MRSEKSHDIFASYHTLDMILHHFYPSRTTMNPIVCSVIDRLCSFIGMRRVLNGSGYLTKP